MAVGARFLMIALDGADGASLDRWSGDGTLPNLAALRALGGATRLTSPRGMTDDGIWASFKYSSGMGETGRYHWEQRLESGRMGMAYLNETGSEGFWDKLSNQGMRVMVFDVPKCGVPGQINGMHLVDWLVHGKYFKAPKSYPEELAAEVVEKFGTAPPSRCSYEGPPLTDADVQEVTANLRRSVAQKGAAGVHYLGSEMWDLFLISFKEAHCAGHHLWNLADPGRADEVSKRAAALGEPYQRILMDLDAAVGQLVATVGPESAIAVFSTTDMEPNATLVHLMPEFVKRLNAHLGDGIIKRGIRKVLRRALRRILPIGPTLQPCELLPYGENCTALRVNARQDLLGRGAGDARGKAERLESIESIFRELTDAETGEPVVAAIDRPSAIHEGARVAALPDLLIICKPGTIPRAIVSPLLGRIEAKRPDARAGNHAAGGFLIYAGESLASAKGVQDLGRMVTEILRRKKEVTA
jgi:hypothetical protein